jgi:hypothetical protein
MRGDARNAVKTPAARTSPKFEIAAVPLKTRIPSEIIVVTIAVKTAKSVESASFWKLPKKSE